MSVAPLNGWHCLNIDCHPQATIHSIPRMRLHPAPLRLPRGYLWQPTALSPRLPPARSLIPRVRSLPYRHAADNLPRVYGNLVIILPPFSRQHHQSHIRAGPET